jgi:hypothetical protein
MLPNVKKAAVKKYGQMILDQVAASEVEKAIAAEKGKGDKAKYSPDEVKEILEGAFQYEPEPAAGNKAASAVTGEGQKTLNKVYEEWSVEPQYDILKDPFDASKTKRVLKSGDKAFEKIKKMRTTSITEDRAETLNSQSEQSHVRLYLAK